MIQQRPRLLAPVTFGLVVVAAILAAVAWYLVSPLFIDRRVNETFPTAAAAPAGGGEAARGVPAQGGAMSADTAAEAAGGAPDGAMQAMNDVSAGAAVGGNAPEASAQQEMAPHTAAPSGALSAAQPPDESVSQPPDGPVATRRGSFGDVDAVHKGEGEATLYRLPDGRTILRLENFRVTNGPDLYVYLSGHPAPRSSAELHQDPDYEVAVLKGNVGDQNYELPADWELEGVKSVVIYCKRFTTVFSTAELQPA